MRHALWILLVAGACAVVPPPLATPADAQRAHLDLADLQRGRELLIQKCGGCHRVPMPSDARPEDWPAVLVQMYSRAKCEPAERVLIRNYLVALSQR